MDNVKIISGSSNKFLVLDICEKLYYQGKKDTGYPVNVLIDTFADGESRIEINEDVRGKDVFVIQSLSYPVNHHLVELCLILDALKRSNVNSITVILPYYGYARQDKKTQSRVPISAKTVATIIESCGLDRLVTIDLHSSQIQGYYEHPVDNLYGSILFLDHAKDFVQKYRNVSCISPDAGGLERTTHLAKKLDCSVSFCYKHRKTANKINEMRLIGDVKGKNCLIIDDMYDTCNTMIKCASILKENGAERIESFATHGIFSKDSVENISNSYIDKINVTNTINLSDNILKNNKFNILNVDELITMCIVNIHENKSISKLFI